MLGSNPGPLQLVHGSKTLSSAINRFLSIICTPWIHRLYAEYFCSWILFFPEIQSRLLSYQLVYAPWMIYGRTQVPLPEVIIRMSQYAGPTCLIWLRPIRGVSSFYFVLRGVSVGLQDKYVTQKTTSSCIFRFHADDTILFFNWQRDLWKEGYERDRPPGHRVDRELGFFSSRPNWDSPTHRRVCPLPLWFRGWEYTRWWERGWGVPARTRVQTL